MSQAQRSYNDGLVADSMVLLMCATLLALLGNICSLVGDTTENTYLYSTDTPTHDKLYWWKRSLLRTFICLFLIAAIDLRSHNLRNPNLSALYDTSHQCAVLATPQLNGAKGPS